MKKCQFLHIYVNFKIIFIEKETPPCICRLELIKLTLKFIGKIRASRVGNKILKIILKLDCLLLPDIKVYYNRAIKTIVIIPIYNCIGVYVYI